MTRRLVVALFAVLAAPACDVNVFESFEEQDTPEAHAEFARMALDRHEYQEAIDHLELAVAQDPGNLGYQTDLASAYSGRAGLDVFRLAKSLHASAVDAETDQVFLQRIVSTDTLEKLDGETLADLTRSLAILTDDIDQEAVTREVRLQRAIVQLAHAATTPLAIGDRDRDRKLDELEMLSISDDAFNGMLRDIRDANGDVKKVAGNSEHIGNFTARIDTALADIAAQPGDTDAQRVRNYVAAQLGAR